MNKKLIYGLMMLMLLLVLNLVSGCNDKKELKRELESLVYEEFVPNGFYYCDAHMRWGLPVVVDSLGVERWNHHVVRHKVLQINASEGKYKDCWNVCVQFDPSLSALNPENSQLRFKKWKSCISRMNLQVFRRNGQFLMDNVVMTYYDKDGKEINRNTQRVPDVDRLIDMRDIALEQNDRNRARCIDEELTRMLERLSRLVND